MTELKPTTSHISKNIDGLYYYIYIFNIFNLQCQQVSNLFYMQLTHLTQSD